MRFEERYDSLLIYYCQPDLDWRVAKAQMLQESRANPMAVSRVGARGLFQFMRQTWREWWDGTPGIQQEPPIGSIENPELQIQRRCNYMRWLLRQHHGSLDEALAAYNWGTGNVRKAIVTHGMAWRTQLPRETTDYIEKIRRMRMQFA